MLEYVANCAYLPLNLRDFKCTLSKVYYYEHITHMHFSIQSWEPYFVLKAEFVKSGAYLYLSYLPVSWHVDVKLGRTHSHCSAAIAPGYRYAGLCSVGGGPGSDCCLPAHRPVNRSPGKPPDDHNWRPLL